MVGNPKPRAVAEEVAALLGELYDRVPRTRRPRRVRAQEDERYLECHNVALGDATAGSPWPPDATWGNGIPWYRRRGPRWWRRSEQDWPGGWPGPDPLALIREMEQRSD